MAESPLCAGLGQTTETSSKQRRSGRLTLSIPILIIGSDSEGRVFSEETHTVVVSLHGAGIVSRHHLIAEQELILRDLHSNRETEVRVVGEIGSQGAMHAYGVAFLDPAVDFWQRDLPPPQSWTADPLLLQCGGCKGFLEIANGEFEYDICAVHGGLARHCSHCGMLTVWKRSHEVMPAVVQPHLSTHQQKPLPVRQDVAVAPQSSEKKDEFVSLADSLEGIERRTRVRAKVNFFACVRTDRFGDDVVQCLDMSRGGVSFRGRLLYEKGMSIQIAVPYSPEAREAPALFVKGRIAYVRELNEGTWRFGVEFLR